MALGMLLFLDRKNIIDLFIDPPANSNFYSQILLLKQKYKGEYLKEEATS